MNRSWTLLAVLTSAALLTGCGKKYGAGCEKESELSAPWTEMGLPMDGNTRVCASSADELKLRSYEWTTTSDAKTAIESAMLAAGYSKDRCNADICYYVKDGNRVSVHPMDFSVNNKKLETVVMQNQKDRSTKK